MDRATLTSRPLFAAGGTNAPIRSIPSGPTPVVVPSPGAFSIQANASGILWPTSSGLGQRTAMVPVRSMIEI